MSQILINIGSSPNDGTGDPLRNAFSNVNANFTELYTAIAGGGEIGTLVPTLTVTATLNSTGNTVVDSSGFTIQDHADTSKSVKFNTSAISTGETRTLTLPNIDDELVSADYPQTLTNKTLSGGSNTFTNIPLASAVSGILAQSNGGTGGLLSPTYGGTGQSATPTDGQLLIGTGTGYALATLTAGSGIAITNLPGQIVIDNTGGGGGGGGGGSSIGDGTTTVVASNVVGAVTTSIQGTQKIVTNANLTTFSTGVQLTPGTVTRAPLVFPAGSLLNTPQNGAIEYDSTKFYVTYGGVRKQIATYDQITAGTVTSFNTRTGSITLTSADVVTALAYTPFNANVGGNIGAAIRVTGNITTVSPGGTSGVGTIITGNVLATGGTVTAANFVGALSTAAQPNVTSVGTLTGLSVAGDASVTGNLSADTLTGTLQTASQTNITQLGTLNSLIMGGDIAMNGNYLSGLGVPAGDTDATTKKYVDDLVAAVPRDYIFNGTTKTQTNYGDVTFTILNTAVATVDGANVSTTGNLVASKSVYAPNVITTGATISTEIRTSGNVTGANIVANTGIYGTIRTATQTNITSVGTLTNLAVTNSVTVNSANNVTAIVNGGANGTGNIGTSAGAFNTVFATNFQGTALQAKYADLAEKYTTDQEYPTGTVVAVGGDAEVTASKEGDLAIGVISEKPAYLMNKDSDGQAVALKGRVPVFVTGPVNKGDRLIATDNGCARAVSTHMDVFAVALETNHEQGTKLVEAIIL